MLDQTVAPAGDGGAAFSPHGASQFSGRTGLDRELNAVTAQAALLRDAATRAGADGDLPSFPPLPRAPRSLLLRRAAITGIVIVGLVVVVEGLNAAEFLIGSPARPTLVGHNVGSPSETTSSGTPATPTAVPSAHLGSDGVPAPSAHAAPQSPPRP
jgi:hypothetical protein